MRIHFYSLLIVYVYCLFLLRLPLLWAEHLSPEEVNQLLRGLHSLHQLQLLCEGRVEGRGERLSLYLPSFLSLSFSGPTHENVVFWRCTGRGHDQQLCVKATFFTM